MTDVTVAIKPPTLSQTEIEELKFSFGAKGLKYKIELNQALLGYDWRELMRGKLKFVDIRSSKVFVAKDEAAQVKQNSSGEEPAAILPKNLYSLVPFDKLTIGNLKVVDKVKNAKLDLSGNISKRDGKLNLKLSSPSLELGIYKLAAANAIFSLDTATIKSKDDSASGNLELDQLSGSISQFAIPQSNWTIDWELTPQKVLAKIAVKEAPGPTKLTGTIEQSLGNGKGRLSVSLKPISLTPRPKLLYSYLPASAKEIRFQNGILKASSTLGWEPGRGLSTSEVKVWLDDANGEFKEVVFQNLAVSGEFENFSRIKTSSPIEVSIGEMNPGIPIINTQLELDLLNNKRKGSSYLVVRNASGNIFGGEVSTANVVLDNLALDRGKTMEFPVKIKGILVEKILSLYADKSISGNGTLDGELPLAITKAGASVKNGKIRARKPGGWIRLANTGANKALAEKNAGLGIAFKALENYRYNSLELDINYQNDGTLLTAAKFRGHHPNFNNGRDINFNINVEENILKLMESLRVTERVSKSIANAAKSGKSRQ